MEAWLNLLEDTKNHLLEGAKSVKAYTTDNVYIITQVKDSTDFWITKEEPGFPKTKTATLDSYFQDVFGIEANY
jgi:hypothetical protein